LLSVELTPQVAVLSVQDSGIGIPADEQERVFERFYRVRGDRGERSSGSGLGLNLAAWIAEQHQTSIQLQSAVGAGSRFSIALPRCGNELVPARTRHGKDSVPAMM
jgi:signal transduction histidine kinase